MYVCILWHVEQKEKGHIILSYYITGDLLVINHLTVISCTVSPYLGFFLAVSLVHVHKNKKINKQMKSKDNDTS